MASPRDMEPTDLEKGELRPLLSPTSAAAAAPPFAPPPPPTFTSFPPPLRTSTSLTTLDTPDTLAEATTTSLLTTITTSTATLCSALLISLYHHPTWLAHLLDLSRMPCSHPNHQPSHFISEIPPALFYASCVVYALSASGLYHHRRAKGDAHQDVLLAAGLLMGLTAGLGLGFGVEDLVRVAVLWAVSSALVGSAVGHEVLALVVQGDEEDEGGEGGYGDEMVGRRGSVMSQVAGEFGGVWRERGGSRS